MISEMQSSYKDGEILAPRQLFQTIIRNDENDCSYDKDSDSLEQPNGRKTDFESFKKRYAKYFEIGN